MLTALLGVVIAWMAVTVVPYALAVMLSSISFRDDALMRAVQTRGGTEMRRLDPEAYGMPASS